MATFRLPKADVEDPMAAVRAWIVRMSTRFGPRVWDQEHRVWLSWENALSRQIHGHLKTWLLDTPVWDETNAAVAFDWEFDRWPIWAVKAHLVDVSPCEFEDHQWVFRLDSSAVPSLVCLDPCDDPRVYCDAGGRYVFPACQAIPDLDCMKLDIPVRPEWVYHSDEDWWLELVPLLMESFTAEVIVEDGWSPPPEWRTR